jgi:hypothetical protein
MKPHAVMNRTQPGQTGDCAAPGRIVWQAEKVANPERIRRTKERAAHRQQERLYRIWEVRVIFINRTPDPLGSER